MKRLFTTLLFFFVVYFGAQILFGFWGNGHDKTYEIESDGVTFNVHEKLVQNASKEHDNYFFEITLNDSNLSFQTYENFKGKAEVISDIKYYKDDKYECFLPLFDGEVIVDLMCKKENVVNFYHNMQGNSAIDEFVSTIGGYDAEKWQDQKDDTNKSYPLTIYNDNVLDDYFIGIANYKGIYTINNINLKKFYDVKIFSGDVYDRAISTTLGKYYVTADYSQLYEFDTFKVVDLTNNKIHDIKTTHKLSYNSYIQGNVENSVYIFDPDAQAQYELNLKTMNLILIGDKGSSIKYYNNGWETKDAYEATTNKLYFKVDEIINDYEDDSYYKIDKFGNEQSGFYYLYKKEANGYDAYRMDVQNKNQVTYLFHLDDLSNITYIDDFIYFKNGDEIKYYSDRYGLRTLALNEEFNFNQGILYTIYHK